ncbi:MAG: glutamine--fructose-6-phosphate transaminase (isomerizing) [Ignavibacteriota bacterium]|jgi:glucosamine--fructose-6-phosphate aminotransferase (isomerizing)|nr:glutamine--fructose-6-phosphate transaminase (isomerizing) [Ignavibacteriota bacterium]MBW7843944.1 glutamine--fructose-6-phosphate transaminase (isomerizing) [Ignavibacterium sp.]MCO6447545.1 glutamine--fructose-6-phosphate transaminase (isomerizing) [Ignavibacterium album]MCZ2267327.1 glutamine--fructose-6-phosphate transaminase (isomerizing) [Ignavibacteriales bacterium]MDX9711865.1 glutamine--fructose-6-phosphate transaminase (isomerizing) [Ignavibacteriaceae bacterium]
MCGIVGYVGNKNCVPILINGLKRLEYRGYDSAGIGIVNHNSITIVKNKGKVSFLEEKVDKLDLESEIGLGHTRWATHGIPNELNAHPHANEDQTIFLIHNGIIENYQVLKKGLQSFGYEFKSETDSEVLVHLIDSFTKRGHDITKSVQLSLHEVEGTYGLAVISSKEPDKIIAARKGSPLVVGIGDNENFIASDVSAIISYTKQIVYLEDGEIAVIKKNEFTAKTAFDNEIEKEIHEISMTLDEIDRGGYAHFMLKEIMEQPESLRNSIRGRIIDEDGRAILGGLRDVVDKLADSKRIILAACGTSWHAGLVGEYMFEQFCRIPTEVEYASEFRYRNPVIEKEDTVFFISQSGETADTLAALKEAKIKGALVLGICNVVGSSIARETQAGVYTHAGPEIGVASTKAFTTQLTVLALISLLIARKKNLSKVDGQQIASELKLIPEKVEEILKLNLQIEKIAEEFKDASNFLYLGRGYNFPVALEGALKLKEISYIHAEGYPAAEMKHGPIALIDENMPVVFIAPKDSTYDKIVSNIQEVKARGGRIIAIITEEDEQLNKLVDYAIRIPSTIRMLMPILTVIPLQLLAYHIAVKKGLNVDQPRNLAKSVTVE